MVSGVLGDSGIDGDTGGGDDHDEYEVDDGEETKTTEQNDNDFAFGGRIALPVVMSCRRNSV